MKYNRYYYYGITPPAVKHLICIYQWTRKGARKRSRLNYRRAFIIVLLVFKVRYYANHISTFLHCNF